MNAMDIALLGAVVGFTALGYVRGFLRQAVTLLTFYLAAVLAAQYHIVVGDVLGVLFRGDPTPRAAVAFALVFFWAALFLSWTVRHIYPSMRLRGIGLIDNLLGAVLGTATGLVFVCLASAVISFGLSVPWPESDSVRLSLSLSARTSSLMPIVASYTPAIQRSITLWFPSGAPLLFSFMF